MTRSGKTRPDPREIDLVALDGNQVVFVEVKTLRNPGRGDPANAVGERKRRRMARAALRFLAERGWHDRVCRFDVVAVQGSREDGFRVRHIPDAFRL